MCVCVFVGGGGGVGGERSFVRLFFCMAITLSVEHYYSHIAAYSFNGCYVLVISLFSSIST